MIEMMIFAAIADICTYGGGLIFAIPVIGWVIGAFLIGVGFILGVGLVFWFYLKGSISVKSIWAWIVIIPLLIFGPRFLTLLFMYISQKKLAKSVLKIAGKIVPQAVVLTKAAEKTGDYLKHKGVDFEKEVKA